jgi:hypothetical protein
MPRFAQIPRAVANAVRDAYMPFRGGLDQETSPWEVKAGALRDALNYEAAIEGGYEDIQGYERLDGRASPSAAIYHILEVNITGSFSAGDTVTGVTSTATAYVVSVVTDVGDNDYLVLTKLSGNFQASENLQVSAVTEGTAIDAELQEGASTKKLDAQYRNLAADVYRSDIGVVPGEGSILGVWTLNDVDYAFRNASGGATAKMYKATSSGWTEVSLGWELDFTSGGTHEILDGDTITGGTSGETATVGRVILESGTWAGGNAAGRLILTAKSGAFQAENLDEGANANVATIAGDATAITLQPSGAYEFENSNFMNPTGDERMYGVDGVNRGFEFDGTVFVPIDTGMATDTPNHLAIHKQQLMYAYGSSHQSSGINTAYDWTILSGASEIVTDGLITGYEVQPGQQGNAALLISTRNRMYVLYGASSADWELVRYRAEVGAYVGTLQTLPYTVFLHDQGISSLQATQAFGNFKHGTFSQKIQTLVSQKRSMVVGSCIVRDKNQYRLFFSDGSAIYTTFAGTKVAAMMPVQFEDEVTCVCSLENSSGEERILFGSDNGYVYQMDKGTSFDGEDITATFDTHFTNDSIRLEKTFQDTIVIEARGDGYSELDFSYDLDYGSPDTFQSNSQTAELDLSSQAYWDLFTWDSFFWDGQSLRPTEGVDLRGYGENISFKIHKKSDYYAPMRLTGIHYRYVARKRKT